MGILYSKDSNNDYYNACTVRKNADAHDGSWFVWAFDNNTGGKIKITRVEMRLSAWSSSRGMRFRLVSTNDSGVPNDSKIITHTGLVSPSFYIGGSEPYDGSTRYYPYPTSKGNALVFKDLSIEKDKGTFYLGVSVNGVRDWLMSARFNSGPHYYETLSNYGNPAYGNRNPWGQITYTDAQQNVYRWSGSSWDKTATIYRWDGSNWVNNAVAYRWNGSNWEVLT